MQIRRLRPLYYGAFLWIPQLAAAEPDEPAPEKPVWLEKVRASACPAGWAIDSRDDREIRLVDGEGRVVSTKSDLDVVNRWLDRCRKGVRK